MNDTQSQQLPHESRRTIWVTVALLALVMGGGFWWLTSTPAGRRASGTTEAPPVQSLSLYHAPVAAKAKSAAPAPTVKRGKKRHGMATWIASGAGIAAVDGVFTPITGGWSNGTYFLYESSIYAGVYYIGTVLGEEISYGHVPYSSSTGLPGAWGYASTPPYSGTPAAGAAPTLAAYPAISIGADDAGHTSWATAANRRYSKYGHYGGFRDTVTPTSADLAPAVAFRCNMPVAGGPYHATLTDAAGHLWSTATGIIGDDTDLVSGSFPLVSGSGLPFSAGSDSWETWLGSAGSKGLVLTLYDATNTQVGDPDTSGSYECFIPAVVVATDPATTVPDRFTATLAFDEWWATFSPPAHLSIVQGGSTYDFEQYPAGLDVVLNGTTPVSTTVPDLAFVGTFSGSLFSYYIGLTPGAVSAGGPPDGAFVLRAQPEGPIPKTDTALTHAQVYTLQITAPSTGAALGSGLQSVGLFLAQGWYIGTQLKINGELITSGSLSSGVDGDGFVKSRIVWLYNCVSVAPGDTSITADWGYVSGSDWISLATATIAITVAADGGISGGGEGGGGGAGPPVLPPTPPVGPGLLPWVEWVIPPTGSTVVPAFTGTLAFGNFTPTVTGHLNITAVKGAASVVLLDADRVLASAGTLVETLDFAAAPDGTYTLYVTLSGVPGEEPTTSAILILASGGSSDTTPPTVTLTAPTTGATISGSAVTLSALAADDTAVWRVAWLVDDAVIGYSFAPALATSYAPTWILDTRTLINGSHTISAIARDTSGNVSTTATITVTVTNSMADLTRYIFDPQMGVDSGGTPLNAQSNNWTNRDKAAWMIDAILPKAADLGDDPRAIYNLFPGFNVPGTSATWTDFSLVDFFTRFASAPTKTIRFGMCVMPSQVQASFDITAASLVRFATAANGDPLILALTPHSIQRFSVQAGAIVQFADLSSLPTAPTDIAAFGGDVFVAAGDYIYVYSEKTGLLTQRLQFWPDVVATVDHLATDGKALYIAATLDATGTRIYSYTFAAPVAICDYAHAITSLQVVAGTVYAGDAAGNVLTVGTSAVGLAYATGEAAIARVGANGSTLYAGTGTSGKVFVQVAVWGLNWDAGFTSTDALAAFNNWMWAAGTGTGARYVWYEKTPGVWAQGLDTDSLVTAIPDMLTITNATTKAQQLFILATRSGGTCRLYRVELAPPSKWQCGPNVPPFMGTALA